MKVSVSMSGVGAALKDAELELRAASLKGITGGIAGLKEDLRAQTEAAGFSNKLVKTWQSKVYANDGKNPAGIVYSKAPKIIDAFARGATIVATGGKRLLALPTDEVPKGAKGASLTPAQVEDRFRGKLRFVPSKNNERAVGFLVLDSSARAKSRGKPPEPVVMFVLVRQVKAPKVFDLEASAEAAGVAARDIIAAEFEDDA